MWAPFILSPRARGSVPMVEAITAFPRFTA